MVAPYSGFHYCFINIELQVLPYMVEEHIVQESQVGGSNVLEAERHDIRVVVAMIRHKGRLGCIQGIHSDLVIPEVGVYQFEREVG